MNTRFSFPSGRIASVIPALFVAVALPGALLTAASPASAANVAVTKDAPDSRRFLDGLAQAERRHDYRALLAACDHAIAARPDDYENYRRRALARWGARQYDGALADFDHAATLAQRQKAPARVSAVLCYGRALIRREQHNPGAEATELERATSVDRSFTDAVNDLAWIRATNADASLRDGREAVSLARRACDKVPGSVKYLDTLAAAYAEAGDPKRAADTEKEAIKAARVDARTEGEHKEFLAGAPGRVDLYAGGGRYRDMHPADASSAKPAMAAVPAS